MTYNCIILCYIMINTHLNKSTMTYSCIILCYITINTHFILRLLLITPSPRYACTRPLPFTKARCSFIFGDVRLFKQYSFTYPASIDPRYRSSVLLLFKQHSTHYPASTQATILSSIQSYVIKESFHLSSFYAASNSVINPVSS